MVPLLLLLFLLAEFKFLRQVLCLAQPHDGFALMERKRCFRVDSDESLSVPSWPSLEAAAVDEALPKSCCRWW